MDDKQLTFFQRVKSNIRKHLISGIFIVIPVGITFLVLKILFNLLTGNISPLIRLIYGNLPDPAINIISILVFFILIYLAGLIATRVFGQKLIEHGERVLAYIPLVKEIYATAKQVLETLAGSNAQAFSSVVVVDFPYPGVKSIAFKTGTVTSEDGKEFVRVLIPTSPNPTSGILLIVPVGSIQETKMSLEEGMKTIISGGIICPENLKFEATGKFP